MTPFSSTTVSAVARFGPVLGCLLLAACAVTRPQVDAEASISESLALPGAVVFRMEGDPIDAQAGAVDVLRLEDAIRRAVETSPELQAALARVRVAQGEADLAGLLPNPILSLAFRFPEGGGSPDIEAGLAADLLAILQRPRRSSVAGHRLEAQAAAALSSALDAVAEVRDLYASAQVLEELVPLLEGRLSVLDRLREVAQARLELGEGTRHDVTTLDSERLELAVEASRRRQELRLARMTLTRRIGEPSGAATWELDPWQGPPAVPTAESAWIETALRSRPEVLAIQWEIRARGDEVALAGWGALEGTSVGLDAERDGDWSAGPGVSIPLPIFDTGSARQRRASALESEAQHRLVQAQRSVVEEVRTSLAALSGSQQNLDRIVRELVPLQERRRAEIDEAYRLGHVDVTALLFAEQALQQTQTLRVGLEREVSTALLRLERSVGGRSVFDSNVSRSDEGSNP
jgi:cobalt-zinc-cadmium efflux system outer membrane protein